MKAPEFRKCSDAAPSSAITTGFVLSAAVLLLLTAVLKLIGVLGDRDYLDQAAPIFPEFSFRGLLFAVAVVEILCAGFLLRNASSPARCAPVVLWVSSVFLVYRSALWLVGYRGPCNCLGFFGDWFGLGRTAVELVAVGISLYLFFPSLILSVRHWSTGRLGGGRGSVTALALLSGLAGTSEASAHGLAISGDERTWTVDRGRTTLVGRASFVVRALGTNWTIRCGYPAAGTTQDLALVAGRAYTLVSDSVGGSGGYAHDDPWALLDTSPEAVRLLFGALTVGRDRATHLTNAPVPFLYSRHPGLRAYHREVTWSDREPFLPARITFTLDRNTLARVGRDATEYLFGRTAKQEMRAFAASQTTPAVFQVVTWTNVFGRTLPSRASLVHRHYFKGDDLDRILEFEVTGVERLEPPIIPPLLQTDSWIQQIAGGTSYLYQAAKGRWLTIEEAKTTGTRMTRAPPLPVGRRAVLPAVRVLLILLLLAPVLVLWLARGTAKRTPSPKTP